MDIVVKPMEFEDAVRKLGTKTPVGALLRSAEWLDMPLALRERSMFSATVESVRVMKELQDRVLSSATPAEFIAKVRPFMREYGLGRDARGDGVADNADLTNLAGTSRLKLIYEQNLRSARGYGWWKQGQNADVLDAFPAQELLRVEDRKTKRNWQARWEAAGGRTFAGRMIALKSDPVWRKISRFGTPWPPYDFGSGMGVEDVDREEAEALGLIARDAPVKGDEADFNEELQASVKDLQPEHQEMIELAFGDQVKIANGMAQWVRQTPYTDWEKEGLPSAKTWAPAKPMPAEMEPAEARRQLKEGIKVQGVYGEVIFSESLLEHWKGYKDADRRPAFLPAALQAVTEPIEVWQQATQDTYIVAYQHAVNGYRGVIVFVALDGKAKTFFVRSLAGLNTARKGVRRRSG